jgi:hypothetical protein
VAFAVFLATIFILNTTFLPRKSRRAPSQRGRPRHRRVPVQIQSDVIPQVQLIFVISVDIHAFGTAFLAGVLQDGA